MFGTFSRKIMELIKSISGIRGIFGETLTPEEIVKYASAFGEYNNRKPIVIGRDGRITGKIIGNLVSSTLLSMGCDVIALGVVPTPTVQLAVEKFGAAGGISITASHNPIEWNGMKFMNSNGMFLDAEEIKHFLSMAEIGGWKYKQWDSLGNHRVEESFIDKHIELVLGLPYMNVEKIQQRKFKVVVDCINAAGGMIVPKMLRQLGCEVMEMNCDVSGVFAHTPEPIPENLTSLCERVKQEKADLGIAVDPDVDRLVLVNEKGEPFNEEYTIATVVDFVLGEEKKNDSNIKHKVAVNLSTTRAVEDVAKKYGAEVFRTPVGEINVAKKMKEVGAIVGGEGSGGVILTQAHLGRDAIIGIGLILQHVANFGGTLSELKATMPQYFISKDKIRFEEKKADDIFLRLRERFANDGKINNDDGLKIDFTDSWVHFRTSNTEPIVRIIAEAPTTQQAEQLVQQFKQEIQKQL
jgi:phosphomannomutase